MHPGYAAGDATRWEPLLDRCGVVNILAIYRRTAPVQASLWADLPPAHAGSVRAEEDWDAPDLPALLARFPGAHARWALLEHIAPLLAGPKARCTLSYLPASEDTVPIEKDRTRVERPATWVLPDMETGFCSDQR